jgi:hypothetical protein
LSEEEDIGAHMAAFGPVSLIFDPAAALHVGATPVLYFPKFELAHDANEFGLSLIHHLRAVLALVQDIGFITEMTRTDFETLTKQSWSKHQFELVQGAVAALFHSMNLTPARLAIMEGVVQSVSELLYPADRRRALEQASFGHFRQREWRVLGDFAVMGSKITVEVDQQLKHELLALDRDFFGERIIFAQRALRRADLVQRFSDHHRAILLDGVHRIHCRSDVFAAVKKALGNAKISVTSGSPLSN